MELYKKKFKSTQVVDKEEEEKLYNFIAKVNQ